MTVKQQQAAVEGRLFNELARDFPAWRFWRGDGGAWGAVRYNPDSSSPALTIPPTIIRNDPAELRAVLSDAPALNAMIRAAGLGGTIRAAGLL